MIDVRPCDIFVNYITILIVPGNQSYSSSRARTFSLNNIVFSMAPNQLIFLSSRMCWYLRARVYDGECVCERIGAECQSVGRTRGRFADLCSALRSCTCSACRINCNRKLHSSLRKRRLLTTRTKLTRFLNINRKVKHTDHFRFFHNHMLLQN